VEQHDRNTPIPVIEREYAYGSVIYSDEWPAYTKLNSMGYQHSTVNQQQLYVDPVTGENTHRQLSGRSLMLKQ